MRPSPLTADRGVVIVVLAGRGWALFARGSQHLFLSLLLRWIQNALAVLFERAHKYVLLWR
jgi:hypothetical protein